MIRLGSKFCGDVFDGVCCDDLVDVEEALHRAFDLGHAKDVLDADRTAKVGCGLDVCLRDVGDFFDGVDDQTDELGLIFAATDLYDHDAGAGCGLDLRHGEFCTKVHHRDDFASQVDDALHVRGHLGHLRDWEHADDLADLEHRDAVGLTAAEECQVFSGDTGESVACAAGWRFRVLGFHVNVGGRRTSVCQNADVQTALDKWDWYGVAALDRARSFA